MHPNLSSSRPDPKWWFLDCEEDRLMALMASETADPGTTGCDRDFGDEIRTIAAQKAALEASHE